MRIMSKIRKAIHYLRHNRVQFLDSCLLKFGFLFSDRLFLSLRYRLLFGKWIDWNNPTTYNEKLQWLKIYNRRQEYTNLVDKYEVKKYVEDLVGSDYIIPTLGIWDKFDDIDFDALPNQFVLKTTNGGGGTGVVICKDKKSFNIDSAKIKIEKSLKHNLYNILREWPYKDIKPRIIAEAYICDDVHPVPIDYKFYCFNGQPQIVAIATERAIKTCFDYYDMSFNHLEFTQGGPNSSKAISKPLSFDKMISLASVLSHNLPHVRIDLYEIHERIYFGEFTFFDSSGFARFNPENWDFVMGSWIKLPNPKIDA